MTSQIPSLAMTNIESLGILSLFMKGSTMTPFDFKLKSPKARVIANIP
jgi:hypothetical protein